MEFYLPEPHKTPTLHWDDARLSISVYADNEVEIYL
jgi:hypothetical protein